MSHRRGRKAIIKAKREAAQKKMKEADWKYEQELIRPEDVEKKLSELLLKGRDNFHCLKCNSRQHEVIEGPDVTDILKCSNCGWELPLIAPVYFGTGHDHVIGYMLMVQTKDEKELKMHYLGF